MVLGKRYQGYYYEEEEGEEEEKGRHKLGLQS
jgi:hypothetical protein